MVKSPEPVNGSKGNGGGNGKNGDGAADAVDPFSHPVPKGAARSVSQVLGEITWLMSQSALHKSFFISDLEWMVMTPVLMQQFRLFYDKQKPIGVAFWAKVNDAVEERLKTGNARLQPAEWRSGDKLWCVEIIAPFGGHEEMLKDLKQKVFPETELNYLFVSPKGKEVKRV